MNVLVTGGAGYIGSHAARKLLDAGHAVTVIDSLVHGHRAAVDPRAFFVQADTADTARVAAILRAQRVDAVMHFAAYIEVGESVADPAKYYANNFANGLALLEALRAAGVTRFIFSSTAAVYGDPTAVPIDEDHPRRPINPYGRSKMMMEMALEDFTAAYGLGYTILRYFNVAGAAPDASLGENHEPESHLIPRVLAAALRPAEPLTIFGTDYPTADGTCVRDYVHVEDLAQAHLLALEKTTPGRGAVYNVGSEKGFSVREVLDVCRQVTGKDIPAVEKPRRPGDPAVLVAGSAKIRRELNWRPDYPDLSAIVRHAWAWHSSRPDGYPPASSATEAPAVSLTR